MTTTTRQLPLPMASSPLSSVPLFNRSSAPIPKMEQNPQANSRTEAENATSSAFANGPGPSIPSLSNMPPFSVINHSMMPSTEIEMLAQPSIEERGMSAWLSTNYTPNALHMSPAVKSLELPDNIDVALTHNGQKSDRNLPTRPSTGLDTMQSIEDSLEVVHRSMELQKSMDIEYGITEKQGY